VTALALALALAGSDPGVRTTLPPAPVKLFRIAWERPLVGPRPFELKPLERGGIGADPEPKRGLAFLGTRDGWLHAIRRDGSVAWELRAGGGFGPPLAQGDTVYAGSSDGKLYAVAIATGKPRWIYDAKEDLSTRPALADGMVLVASLRDTVFAVDAANGAWKWHHRREAKETLTIFGAASVQVSGDTAFAAYSDGYASALDFKTGATRWERRVAPAGTHLDVDALLVDGGRVYAAAYSGAVLCLDARGGETIWSFEAPGAAQLALAGGLVVAVTSSSVHGLSPVDGGAIWTTPLGGSPAGVPLVVGKWLLVPAGRGGLRWLEASTGRLLRVFEPGTGVSASPGAVDGRVYVLSNGGDLFALDLG
jgi:outer membrane protein assembly factor BamB